MSDNQPQGAIDGNGRWQPGFHDAQGTWHGGFYDAHGQWQPGFYDQQGTWQAGFHDPQGGWHPGFRAPDGTWTSLSAPAAETKAPAGEPAAEPAAEAPAEEASAEPESPAEPAAPALSEPEAPAEPEADAVEQPAPAEEQEPAEHPAPAQEAPTAVLPPAEAQTAPAEAPAQPEPQPQSEQPPAVVPPLTASTPDSPAGPEQPAQAQSTPGQGHYPAAPAAGHPSGPAPFSQAQPAPYQAAEDQEPPKKGNGNRGMCLVLIVLSVITLGILAVALWLLLINEDTRQWELDLLSGSDDASVEDEDDEPADDETGAAEDPEEDEEETVSLESGYFVQEPDESDFELGEEFAELPSATSPVGTVTFEEFAEVESVQADGETAVAAEGEELRYVAWSYTPADDEWDEDGELTVRIAGEEQSGTLSEDEVSGSFIASVSEDDALILNAHGVEQEISLTDGEASAETASLFSLPEIPYTEEVGETFSFPEQTLDDGDDEAEHETQLILNRAMLTYEHEELDYDEDEYDDGYNEDHSDNWMLYGLDSTGPAEEGHIWLILDMRIEMQGPDGTLDFDGGTWTITATDEDGETTEHQYTSEASGIDQWPYGNYGAALQIPVSASTVELSAELDIEFDGGSETIETDEPIILEFPVEESGEAEDDADEDAEDDSAEDDADDDAEEEDED